MRRPMVVIAAAVLSGILYGLPGIPFVYRLVPTVYLIGAVLLLLKQCGGKPKLPLYFFIFLLGTFFSLSYVRASNVTAKYEQNAEFYEKYEATNPGEFDYALYLKSMDVETEKERKSLKTRDPETENGMQRLLGDFREKCQTLLMTYFSEKDAGILASMLLGNKQAMDEAERTLYQEAGIAHLLAISGLHVSMIGAGIVWALRKGFAAGKKMSAILSSLGVGLFVVITGSALSSLRAFIMFLAGAAALFQGRKKDLACSLGLAAVLLLIYRPYAVTQSGFQLSFFAIAGIIYAVWFSRGWKHGKTLASCIGVTLFTMPVVAFSYFKVPLYSVLINLAVIPLMTAVFLSGAAVLICALPGIFQTLPFLLGAPAHYILKLYESLCEISLKMPYSSILLGRPGHLQIVFYYTVILAAGLMIRSMKDRRYVPLVVIGTYLASFPLLKYREDKACYVTVLDVGQGDCFFIHTPDAHILIDCGSSGSYETAGSRILENYLLSKGISDIDLCIVSHADSDHTNGIVYLYSDESSVKVHRLALPPLAKADEKYDRLKQASNKAYAYYKAGDAFTANGMKLQCIYAKEDISAISDTNRESGVWYYYSDGFSMLFTGDISETEETDISSYIKTYGLKIDVLKCAHHGSDTANSERFLKAADPDYAVLSYGKNNRYGHPSKTVTNRLKELGIKMLCTEKTGAISFLIGEKDFDIAVFR